LIKWKALGLEIKQEGITWLSPEFELPVQAFYKPEPAIDHHVCDYVQRQDICMLAACLEETGMLVNKENPDTLPAG
jgi:hypothetical protein